MTTEEKLREYILSKYGTCKDFADKSGLPYGTVMTILKRGIKNSTASNVLAMCETLNISADALGAGMIIPADEMRKPTKTELLPFLRSTIASDDIAIDGIPVSADELATIIEALEISVEMIRRRRK